MDRKAMVPNYVSTGEGLEFQCLSCSFRESGAFLTPLPHKGLGLGSYGLGLG